MKKSFFNMIVDALSLLVFMSMISTGLIMKYVLPPGSGRVEKLLATRGHGAMDVYFGLSRHDWGQIHFWISMAFLGLLIVHLVLHWNWVVAVSVSTSQSPLPLKRKLITLGIVLFVCLALAFPWIGPKERLTKNDFIQTSIKEGSLSQ